MDSTDYRKRKASTTESHPMIQKSLCSDKMKFKITPPISLYFVIWVFSSRNLFRDKPVPLFSFSAPSTGRNRAENCQFGLLWCDIRHGNNNTDRSLKSIADRTRSRHYARNAPYHKWISPHPLYFFFFVFFAINNEPHQSTGRKGPAV